MSHTRLPAGAMKKPPARPENLLLLIVLQFLVLLWLDVMVSVSGEGALTSVGGVEFGEMATERGAQGYVFHVEVDITDENMLLYADMHALVETDGTTPSILVGSTYSSGYLEATSTEARFKFLMSFAQINSTAVIASDQYNHCLRLVDRITLRTEAFAGTCQTSGNQTGLSALFNRPWHVVINQFDLDQLLLSDSFNMVIRVIDLNTKMVSTLSLMALTKPAGLTFDLARQKLLVASQHMVTEHDLSTGENRIITGNASSGAEDGGLAEAHFYLPTELMFISKRVLLVRDRHNHKLRVVNLDTGQVHSICSGTQGHTDGSLASCQLMDPLSLLLSDGKIYIGHHYKLRVLSCPDCCQPGPDSGWGACYREGGACVQTKQSPASCPDKRSCPTSCDTGMFSPTERRCPNTILSTHSAHRRLDCLTACLSSDFCTGFMHSPTARVCQLVDGFEETSGCDPTDAENWAKRP